MDITVTLLPEFPCVYLLSGEFFEGNKFSMRRDGVVFVTVLPLDATYIPYTVKLTIGDLFKIGEDYAIKLPPRHSLIYLPDRTNKDVCMDFFYSVKRGDIDHAFEIMTESLSKGLSKAALSSFFDEYSDIAKGENCYYLVSDGVGYRCDFILRGDRIDNITVE